MKNILFTTLLLATFISGFSQNIYVSNSGNTTGDGSINNPFDNIFDAQEKVREIIQSPSGMTQNITVNFRGGVYELDKTLDLNADDSGVNGFKVIYQSYPGEQATISGGKNITSMAWMPHGFNIYKTFLPLNFFNLQSSNTVSDLIKRKGFRQLYVDNIKATRARHFLSNQAKITLNETTFQSYTIENSTGIPAIIKNTNLELITREKWKEIRIPIIDKQGQDLIINNTNDDEFKKLLSTFEDKSYYQNAIVIENDLSFVDEPGEWYFDKDTNWLYYYPLLDQDVTQIEVVVPILEELVRGNDVKNIEFKGVTFSHATWYKPNQGYFHRQADQYGVWDANNQKIKYTQGLANIEFIKSENVIFENNIFKNLGAIGLRFDDGSDNNLIIDNTFTSIASNAISIGTNDEVFVFEQPGDPRSHVLLCKNNRIGITESNIRKGNTIHKVADEFRGSVGIFIGNSQKTIVTDNIIYDLPYTGISVGFSSKNSVRSAFGGHLILRNKIDNVVNLLEDGAGIYNFYGHSANLGAVQIDNNIINIDNFEGKHRCAIYLDEESSNISVLNNSGDPIKKFSDWKGQEQDMHIYNHIKQRTVTEEENITIKNNSFGISSLWIERNNYNLIKEPGVTEIPSFSKDGIGDLGVRFVDVDHDGYKDLLVNRYIASGNNFKAAILNTKEKFGWRKNLGLQDNQTRIIDELQHHVPFPISQDGVPDLGSRFVDINGDGFKDYVHLRRRKNSATGDFIYDIGAYLNLPSRWKKDSRYNIPYPIADDVIGDLGCRFVDVNEDGLKDIVLNRLKTQGEEQKAVYINQNPGWRKITPEDTINNEHLFIPPYRTAVDGIDDIGVRFVDFDGDCDKDMLIYRWVSKDLNSLQNVRFAYENKGVDKGWELNNNYLPPVAISKLGKDNGVRFIDINHDGMKDFVVSNHTQKNVWLNTCQGWETHDVTEIAKHKYSMPPINFVDAWVIDNGVRIVDVDGDGFEDIMQKRTKADGTKEIHYFQNRNPQLSTISCNRNCGVGPSPINRNEILNKKTSIQSIDVYPNPSSGISNLILDLQQPSFVNIKLYGIHGELLREIVSKDFEKDQYKFKIDLSSYAEGIYFCTVRINKELHHKKILKK